MLGIVFLTALGQVWIDAGHSCAPEDICRYEFDTAAGRFIYERNRQYCGDGPCYAERITDASGVTRCASVQSGSAGFGGCAHWPRKLASLENVTGPESSAQAGVRALIVRHLDRIERCWKSSPLGEPTAVQLVVVVDKRGQVIAAAASGDADLSGCITAELRGQPTRSILVAPTTVSASLLLTSQDFVPSPKVGGHSRVRSQ